MVSAAGPEGPHVLTSISPPDVSPYVPQLLLRRPPDAPRQWQVEATTVFIDISGFTSLSEQLARHGRVGAEDLVSTLTRIFTLLMSATDDGGDVVKFAGDALLVMYAGPDHQRHACHAAAKAQQLLGVVGDVRLAGARARLRMSVGVHSGVFDLMLSGRDSQSLVVTGPDLDRVLELQDRAVAGQVLLSAEVASTLPASALGDAVGDGVLLRRPPPVESLSQGAVGVGSAGTVGDLRRYLPAAFAARPDLLAADSDHRRAAMAFVQVSGLGALHAEDRLAEVDALTDVVEEASRDHGVTLLDVDIARDGFRYFLTAGAPMAVEDPEGRLLRAALRIAAAKSPLGVRAGVTSGQVFAGPVGPAFRRTFSVMGDTTNLAARLTARAPAGGVLAHRSVLRRSTTEFALDAHDPITVKGQSAPIPVSLVTAVLGQRERADAEPPFVGRATESADVDRLLAGTRDGRGGTLEILGEAGAGKTRLITRAERTAGVTAARVVADRYGAQVPYRALGQLLRLLLDLRDEPPEVVADRLREAAARVAPETVRWLPLVGTALGIGIDATPAVAELDARFRVARLQDTVRELVAGLVAGPWVLVVDNAQWLDPASAEALGPVFAEAGPRPWAVVMARRDGTDATDSSGPRPGGPETSDAAVTRLRLGPLDDEAATALVTALVGDRRRPAEVRSIVQRADGNPYFLVELATAGAAGDLPDSVEELVGVRIDDLSGRDRDLLRQAAVLGSRFSVRLFAETSGLPDLLETVRAPGLAEFLAVEGAETVVFRREIQREVAYGQLTFRRRREIHGRAGRAIERHEELVGAERLPLLSLHFFEAGEWADAYRWSREAAEQAQAQYANDEAAAFGRRALEAGRRAGVAPAELATVEERLGDVLTLMGDHDAAVRVLQGARRSSRDPERAAELTYKIGMVRRESGRLDAALAAARQTARLAAELSSARGEELLVEADLLRAGVRYWQGRGEQSRRLAETAAERAETLPDGDPRTRLLARAWSLHDTAAVELEGRAGRYGEAPLEMFRAVGDLYNEGRFAGNVGLGEYYEGHWDAAVRLYRRSLEIAERIGDVFGVAVAKMNIGEVLSLQGQSAAATVVLTESVAELQALRVPIATAHAALYLSVALRLGGELEAARARAEESASEFAAAGRDSGFSLDEHASRVVELLVAEERYADAGSATDRLLDRPEPAVAALHRARVLRARALARHALGDAAAAREDLDASLVLARDLPLGYDAALGLLVLADWTDDGAARVEAADILAGLGAEALLGSVG